MIIINAFIVLFFLMVGIVMGIIVVFHKLHCRFDVSWSEEIWPLLRVKDLRPPGAVKLVIAGNHDQFRVWLAGNVKYIRYEHDLRVYEPERVEIIKTGTWWENPVASSRSLKILEVEDL